MEQHESLTADIRENAAFMKELQQKFEGILMQPPPETLSLSDIRDSCMRMMMVEIRRDVGEALEAMHRGVSAHMERQQTILYGQIWSELSAANKLIDTGSYFADLSRLRIQGNNPDVKARSSSPGA